MALNNMFLLLSYIAALSYCLISSAVFSGTVSIFTVLELPLPEFTCSTITHSFDSAPIMSRTLS